MPKQVKTIDQYLETIPQNAKSILEKIRQAVHAAAPEVAESLSYAMPAFKLHGKPLVYMAAWDRHIGLYATPSANSAFTKELGKYHVSKGAIQFPLDKAVPYGLIKKIILFKVKEIKQAARKVCSRGHVFFRSKDMPSCPVCWPGRYKKKV